MKIQKYQKKIVGQLNKDYPQKAFEQLLAFQGYGFNKSHSVSYSYYAGVQLYLKRYYLLQFMWGILNEVDRSDQHKGVKLLQQRVNYCYSNCLKVNAPLVNIAQDKWRIYKNELYASISNIKGLGDKQAQIIMQNRPYDSVKDFLDKTKFGKSKFQTLLFAGCFDEFGDRGFIYNWYYNTYNKKQKKEQETMTLDFGFMQEQDNDKLQQRVFSKQELKELFYEYNGFNLHQNILGKFTDYLSKNPKIKTVYQVKQKKVKFPLMICKVQGVFLFKAKNGKQWAKLTLTDGDQIAQLMMSQSKYYGSGRLLKDGNIIVLPVATSQTEMLFLGNTQKFQIKVLQYGE